MCQVYNTTAATAGLLCAYIARPPPLLFVIDSSSSRYLYLTWFCVLCVLIAYVLPSAVHMVYRHVLRSCSPAVARPPPLLLVLHSSRFATLKGVHQGAHICLAKIMD